MITTNRPAGKAVHHGGREDTETTINTEIAEIAECRSIRRGAAQRRRWAEKIRRRTRLISTGSSSDLPSPPPGPA
jgi:hypothetical protein